MNEFEWRRQMQQLRQPIIPQHDLWPAIERAINADERNLFSARTVTNTLLQPRWLVAAGLAAAVVLSVGAGWHLTHQNRAARPVSGSALAAQWRPADPRLAGAAIELDAARMELQQAMLQAPSSPALQRLLVRTERQQAQLHQLAGQAG